jgi:hypothetical protein
LETDAFEGDRGDLAGFGKGESQFDIGQLPGLNKPERVIDGFEIQCFPRVVGPLVRGPEIETRLDLPQECFHFSKHAHNLNALALVVPRGICPKNPGVLAKPMGQSASFSRMTREDRAVEGGALARSYVLCLGEGLVQVRLDVQIRFPKAEIRSAD